MTQTVLYRLARVCGKKRAVHWLQVKMLKGEALIALGLTARLRVHQLQLVAGVEHELGVRLWRHADPIDAWWRELRAVGLDGDLDARGVERVDKRRVELQQRLPTGAH